MRRFFAGWAVLALLCALAACGAGDRESGSDQARTESTASAADQAAPAPENEAEAGEPRERGVLVACFSATGNTEGVARNLQTVLDADLYEIVPAVPYTSEDLDYSSGGCRAEREQNDPDARPAISGTVENMERYDVVFLGYPIWWGQAPRIIHTFLEGYDFDGVTIVPFCTSGSSGIGSSAEALRDLAPGADWLPGRRFAGGAGVDEVAEWVESLELPERSGGGE